jgi:hypothetical protein
MFSEPATYLSVANLQGVARRIVMEAEFRMGIYLYT